MANRSTARVLQPMPEAAAPEAAKPEVLRIAGAEVGGVQPVGARPLQMALEARLSEHPADDRWSPRRSLAFIVCASGALWSAVALGAAVLHG